MCGGDIEVNEEKTFGTCEYCGSVMTLPKVSDDQRAARFNRGNHFRRQGEFDKALGVYESIVREDDSDAEAHWCCALCRFGIEYVEDPNTFEFLPTCHRASFDNFTDDVDYLAALENSDGITKRQYQKDAAKIAEVQRGILATSQNEEPFDVFICYKETDDSTKERTRDSLDAQDIYYQLTQEGYRVFFARITLEDKVGAEYEPYIFAALNSAKVMIAIGSKPEYFNAVWVKNEWSRFLAMMRKDRSKLLLPCYKGMDPYDLPEQLGVLQSYDMTKIGFMQDLIHGVKKVLTKEEKKQPEFVQQTVVQQPGGNVDSLLKRVELFLEDEEWSSAEEYCQKVLDIAPENGEAYLGLVLAEKKLQDKESFALMFIDGQIENDNKNLKRSRQFADKELKTWFKEIDKKRKAEDEQKQAETIKNSQRCALVREGLSKYRSFLSTGGSHTVGLKADGRVVATNYSGDLKDYHGQCDIGSWTDIVAVSVGQHHTVGLKADGTVIATKYTGKYYFGQCEVSGWTDIVAVLAGKYHTVGLKADGTVVATKYIETEYAEYRGQCDVQNWTNIVAVSAGDYHTVGLKADGTVVATKYIESEYEEYHGQCDVQNWTDIVAVSAGYYHTVGLKADGTVVATKYNGDKGWYFGQCDIASWTDIVAVSAGGWHTVGLKADGTVIATKFKETGNIIEYSGQCNVQNWTDILAVSAGWGHTVGLKADGTVVAVGTNYSGRCNVTSWKLFKTEEEMKADYAKARALQESCEENKLAEAASIFKDLNDYQDSADRAAECDRTYKELKTEREKREKAECEAREARERAERAATQEADWKRREAERQRKITALNTEKSNFQTELANLKGLFTGRHRKEIEARLAQIEKELKHLQI